LENVSALLLTDTIIFIQLIPVIICFIIINMGISDTKFFDMYCDGVIRKNEGYSFDVTVFGRIKEAVQNDTIRYVAAAPPDYRATYTGSGLPFANHQQAFDNTPNKGLVKVIDGTFEINLMYPNSYYIGLGTVIIPPTVYLNYVTNEGLSRQVKIQLSEGIPFRTLTYPAQYTAPRADALFYGGGWDLPVRTQEQILRDSAYPSTNTMNFNFWGMKPPM
jgi:hypothetical protein